MSIEKSILR